MSDNVFLDKNKKPAQAQFKRVLGPRYKFWNELKEHVRQTHGPIKEDWRHYGVKIGWTMKLLLGKRNLLFLTAREGLFVVSLVLGDKAVAAVERSTLPKPLVQKLVDARKYVEGRGIRIEVKSKKALENVKKLVDIKVAH